MSDLYPPVTYLNQRDPWGVPQYVPPSPNNLPVRPEPNAAPNTTQTLAGRTGKLLGEGGTYCGTPQGSR